MTRLIAILRRIPLTLALFLATLTIGIIIELQGYSNWPTSVQHFGWELTTIQEGRIYAAWVGLFFSAVPWDFYGSLLLLLITVGFLEYRRGTPITALGFLLVGPLASIITLMILWPISNAGIAYVRVALYNPDMRSSTACLVCLGILLIEEKGLWRNILLIIILITLGALFYQNRVYNFDHLIGFLVGIITGAIIKRWQKRKTGHSNISRN